MISKARDCALANTTAKQADANNESGRTSANTTALEDTASNVSGRVSANTTQTPSKSLIVDLSGVDFGD